MFHEKYSKGKMIHCSKEHVKLTQYIKRKISPSLTFQIHGLSSFAQVFYHFIFVVVLLNSKQRLPEKRENTTGFHANSNPLEDASNLP